MLQRPLFSTANIASPRYSARAFNLRARTIALCPGTSSAARTARDEERGWKSRLCGCRREGKSTSKEQKKDGGRANAGERAEGRGGDGNARWSERENRQSDGGTETEGNGEVSPLATLRESACSLRRTPGTVFPARTHVREPV